MTTAIILAAGIGSRMRSALPKAMHRIAGQPMLRHLIGSCEQVFDSIVVVVGPDTPALADLAAPHPVVIQHERLGTAHAALQAEALFGNGNVAILYADNPLISPATLGRLLAARRNADLALLAMRPPEPGRYGRVLIEQGRVRRIVEYADASEAERAIGLCNAGVFCAAAPALRGWLHQVAPSAGGEYYLTDIVPHATCAMAVEAPYAELRGINTRAELAAAEASVQQDLRARAMEAGVTMTAPETVFLSFDTQIAPDVVIAPHVVFRPWCGYRRRLRDPRLQPPGGLHRRDRRHYRPVCPPAPGHRDRGRRACRQFRRAEGHPPRRRRQGQPSELSRRRQHRRRQQHRRGKHYL